MTNPFDLSGVSTNPRPPAHAGDVWQLHAKPDVIDRMAEAWTRYGQEARDAAQLIDDRAERLYAEEWAGDVADTYNEHRRKLTRDIRTTADLADTVAGELLRASNTLTASQRQLDGSLLELCNFVNGMSTVDGMVFYPQNDEEERYVEAGIRDAQFVRDRLDDQLLDFQIAITRTHSDWQTMTTALDAIASGTVDPFTMPPEVTGTYLILDGDTVIVNTGTGDDKVQVTTDPATGEQVVTVNGVTHRYPPDAAVTIRTGEGNDEIKVDKNTRVQLTLIGGAGNDTIHGGDTLGDTILGNAGRDHLFGGFGADRISGGADRDYIDGGDGNDVLSGGHGDDTIYGMGGDDAISGGDGQDYLEGARGDDTVSGGTGNDAISGGRGDDTLFGGAGDDKLYGGFGTDAVHGGAGTDDAFAQTGDATTGAEKVVNVELKDFGSFINIDGSPEFVARTEADLDMLRSSPRGQEMLAALEAKNDTFISDTITISEVSSGNEVTSYPIVDHSSVDYNPSKDFSVDDRPPIAGLYHELAHIYDHQYDTSADGTYTGADNPGVPNDEREAVGLPIDHDDDPNTPDQPDPDHPWSLTENGLREELGMPPRPKY